MYLHPLWAQAGFLLLFIASLMGAFLQWQKICLAENGRQLILEMLILLLPVGVMISAIGYWHQSHLTFFCGQVLMIGSIPAIAQKNRANRKSISPLS